jgi:hypothetical protein
VKAQIVLILLHLVFTYTDMLNGTRSFQFNIGFISVVFQEAISGNLNFLYVLIYIF